MMALPVLEDCLRDALLGGRFRSRSKPINVESQVFDSVAELVDPTNVNYVKDDVEAKERIGNEARGIAERAAIDIGNEDGDDDIAPDVVVIDDLGLQIGNLEFEVTQNLSKGKVQAFAEAIGASYWENALLAHRFERLTDDQREYFDEVRTLRQQLVSISLAALCTRLKIATEGIGVSGSRVPIEPVIILSAANHVPEIREEVRSRHRGIASNGRTFWQHIHADETLRRRTIVILDANSLRDDISISSGLSWERTAQDTIVEFNRSEKLRPYLKFGFIVIRYGLAGALLITNNGHDDWSYTLYFSPTLDDSSWSHKEDGVVLGDTSIIVAGIIEQLNERCIWRNGNPLLPDLSHAIDRALLDSVHRLDLHFATGYGANSSEFRQRTSSKKWFDAQVFVQRAEKAAKKIGDAHLPLTSHHSYLRLGVQRTALLPFRSRYWSILAQSCQTELNNVARDIVRFGTAGTLNTLEDPSNDIASIWVDAVCRYLENRAAQEHSFFLLDLLSPDGYASIAKDALGKLLEGASSLYLGKLSGRAFWRSLEKMRDDSELTKKLSEIFETCHFRNAIFDGHLKSLSQVLRKDFNAKDKTSLVSSISSKHPKLLNCSQALLGLESFVNHAKETHPKTEEDDQFDDDKIRRLFGELRDALRYGDLKPSTARHQQRIEDILDDIGENGYAAPIAYLRRAFTDLIHKYEPVRGWPSPISTPILVLGLAPERSSDKDGRLTFVDRQEVESIRAVKRLIEQYLRSVARKEATRPISIAVFGPPGSGKSVAVKKIIGMMGNTGCTTKEIPVNLSQLPHVEALSEVFQDIALQSREGLPVVFFDEFDSALGQKLGWLKYFLAVMEDGEYLAVTRDGKYKKIEIKQAVFVFAGGTSNTFEEFSLADRSRSDPQWAAFSEAKGPDFVSRLKGHINVVGINPSGPDDDLYLIRRALALRHLIGEKQNLRDGAEARIDPTMLNAFLHVPVYVHGSRSMRMLVDLCVSHNKNNIVAMSEVPPIHQLNMQVDGKSFAALASGLTKPVADES